MEEPVREVGGKQVPGSLVAAAGSITADPHFVLKGPERSSRGRITEPHCVCWSALGPRGRRGGGVTAPQRWMDPCWLAAGRLGKLAPSVLADGTRWFLSFEVVLVSLGSVWL